MSSEPELLPLCVFGAGGHGRVVASQVRRRMPQRTVCFGDGHHNTGSAIDGLPVTFSDPASITGHAIIVAIGDNRVRAAIQEELLERDRPLDTFLADPEAFFATRPPGAGSMVLAGSVVNIGASIGMGVIVNSNATVEHDSVIADYCHISPGAVVAGGAKVGARSWVAAGATVLPGVEIPADTVIGAGSVVNRSLPGPGTYIGVPARLLN